MRGAPCAGRAGRRNRRTPRPFRANLMAPSRVRRSSQQRSAVPESREVQQLLSILDQAYDRRSWHGTNLRGSIRGLRAERVAWRPSPGRHNIWEIAVHAAYWKYAVWRRLSHGSRGSFPEKGSNWFRRPTDPTEAAWREDVALLQQMHERMRESIARLTTASLYRIPAGSTVSAFELISGIAAHDLYHAGQIQLLKKLAG
jgi:hypothetical protein